MGTCPVSPLVHLRYGAFLHVKPPRLARNDLNADRMRKPALFILYMRQWQEDNAGISMTGFSVVSFFHKILKYATELFVGANELAHCSGY